MAAVSASFFVLRMYNVNSLKKKKNISGLDLQFILRNKYHITIVSRSQNLMSHFSECHCRDLSIFGRNVHRTLQAYYCFKRYGNG